MVTQPEKHSEIQEGPSSDMLPNKELPNIPPLADIGGLKELLNPLINEVRSLKGIMKKTTHSWIANMTS